MNQKNISIMSDSLNYKEILTNFVKLRLEYDKLLKELQSPSQENRKNPKKFFETLDGTEAEYIDYLEQIKEILEL